MITIKIKKRYKIFFYVDVGRLLRILRNKPHITDIGYAGDAVFLAEFLYPSFRRYPVSLSLQDKTYIPHYTRKAE